MKYKVFVDNDGSNETRPFEGTVPELEAFLEKLTKSGLHTYKIESEDGRVYHRIYVTGGKVY